MFLATATSRLDYCNSLLHEGKQSHITRQQGCQNNAARIMSKRRKFDHVIAVLKELHWLPMEHIILQNSAPHVQGVEWQCFTITRSINTKILVCTIKPSSFVRSISPRFTTIAAWNIWKVSFRKGSPNPLEPSTDQWLKSCIKKYLCTLYIQYHDGCCLDDAKSPWNISLSAPGGLIQEVIAISVWSTHTIGQCAYIFWETMVFRFLRHFSRKHMQLFNQCNASRSYNTTNRPVVNQTR